MKFEYSVYKHFIEQTENKDWYASDCGIADELDRLGVEGWELVSTTPVHVEGGYVKNMLCILKRSVL